MGQCDCQPGQVCTACAAYECEPAEHYCPAWIDNGGTFTCRCGLALQGYEVDIADGDGEHTWTEHYVVWASSNSDAGAWDDYREQPPSHDAVVTPDGAAFDYAIALWGRCGGGTVTSPPAERGHA